MSLRQTLSIASLWDGTPLARPHASVVIEREARQLSIRFDAEFHDDPPPPSAPGPTPELWNYEVLEVMLLGRDERYLELEFGPHGHYLVLELSGVRNVVRSGMPISYTSEIRAGRVWGRASVSEALLPLDCERVNAFAIFGTGARRTHLAWRGGPGERPDFHRLELFEALA